MSRPLRLEFGGALYHVTSRGNRREAIYENDRDRQHFLDGLKAVCADFNWQCHAYCLMSNHYHLLIETPDANLGKGMRQLNGVYSQRFNREHRRVGHVFQGRYKAILVEKQHYLRELARYIVLNPVRSQMVYCAGDWPWSSYLATAGQAEPPEFLQTDALLAQFSTSKLKAIQAYCRFVAQGRGQPSPWQSLRNQVVLGSEAFVNRIKPLIDDLDLREVPRAQKRMFIGPLSEYFERYGERNVAIFQAYQSGDYTLRELGDYVGLHYSTVSGIIKRQKSKT